MRAALGSGKHYLWPCNLHHWQLWQAVQTQWAYRADSISGLRYEGVQAHPSMARLRGRAKSAAWRAIQACEAVVLREVSEHLARQRA